MKQTLGVPSRAQLRLILDAANGEEGLRQLLRRFYIKQSNDILIGFFFTGKDPETIADQQLEFLLKTMGVRKEYTGKTPVVAHRNLPPILAGHFDRRTTLLKETLVEAGFPPRETETWLAFEKAFRPQVVQSD